MTATAVTRREQPPQHVARLLEQDGARRFLSKFLPDGVSYDRFVATVQLAVAKNHAIAQCTPESIVTAVGRALRSGLEIGETAHLVPFGKTLEFVGDYKGIAQLIVASGAVRHVELREVYEGDDFDYAYGLEQRLEHVPAPFKERGNLRGAYVVFRLPFNAPSAFKYMPIEDIDAIRLKYSKQWGKGPCPVWYALKTVLRQAAKTLRKDRRLVVAMRAIEADEEAELGAIPADDDEPPRTPETGTVLEGQREEEDAELNRHVTPGADGYQDDRDLPE